MDTGILKGTMPRNIYQSPFPKVKAINGPLPTKATGFEFVTKLAPAPGYQYTGNANWEAKQGATIEGDWASISVTVTRATIVP
jgi:hypothetical protein